MFLGARYKKIDKLSFDRNILVFQKGGVINILCQHLEGFLKSYACLSGGRGGQKT